MRSSPRSHEPPPARALAAARRRLKLRPDVRLVERVVRERGEEVRLVGGAVRDAFLGRAGGDLDLAVDGADARPFAEALASAAGARAVPIGSAPRRILRVPLERGEVDVWESGGDAEADRDRRDFTVNALSFSLPGWLFNAPPGALRDLARRLLRPPRPGVFLEDPLRVLRAARFLAEIDGFRLHRAALPELRAAGRLLAAAAAERRLVELDRILACDAPAAARGLRALDRWGVLGVLIPLASPAERRRGVRLVRRSRGAPTGVRRALLLLPIGRERALATLESWRVPRRDLRLAAVLFALPRPPRDRAPSSRETVAVARAAAPFVEEAAGFLAAGGDRRLASALATRIRRPGGLERLLSPPRPLDVAGVERLLGLQEGPALGAALRELDTALAAREVRSARGARLHLERWRRGTEV